MNLPPGRRLLSRRPGKIIPTLVIVAVVAGCGQSAADRAAKDVCDARADIQQQVANVKSAGSVDEVKAGLTAIKGDFGKIKDAQPKLSDERKKGVQQANDAFKQQLQVVLSDLAKTRSPTAGKEQLRGAVSDLGQAYQGALGTTCK